MARFRSVKKTWKSKAPKSRALTPAQKADVTRLIKKKAIDYKTRYGTSPAGFSPIPNTLSSAVNYDVSNVVRYDSLTTIKDQCRVGDRIKVSAIHVFGAIRTPAGPTYVRVMLVQHVNNVGVAINTNDVLQYNSFSFAPYSSIEHNCPYKILWDHRYYLSTDQNQLVAIDKYLKFKKPLIVEYDPAVSTGNIAATRSGNIELLICADTSLANPEESLTTTITFYDF